jgi:putative colanic acid biosynthesis acetyltransferase WcaF
MQVNLGTYSSANFNRGASRFTEFVWIWVSQCLFRFFPFSLSPLKCAVLRLFGAQIGKGVVIKPQVKITFPWKLSIGDDVWLGEECWLLNLEKIVIGNNVCISQRAMLCTGSHNYKLPTFDLIVKPIAVEDGAWIGAAAWIGPGVTIGTHAVLTAGSVAAKDLEPWKIYRGNPAEFIRTRAIDFRETSR